VTLMVAIAIYM